MRIIGFGHRSRVGKNTAADILFTYLYARRKHLRIARASFADKLKDIATQLYGWAGVQDAQFYEDNPSRRQDIIKPLGMNVVELWIKLGTPAIREQIYNRTWADWTYYNWNERCDILIVSDLRFPNEFNMIQESGGLCINIINYNIPTTDSVADVALEGEVRWNHVIINNGTLDDLRIKVTEIGEKILGQKFAENVQ